MCILNEEWTSVYSLELCKNVLDYKFNYITYETYSLFNIPHLL